MASSMQRNSALSRSGVEPALDAVRVEVDRRCPTGAPGPAWRRRSVGTRPRSSRTMGRTSKMNSFVVSSACWTIWRSAPELVDATRVALPGRAAPRSRPGARCWRGSAPDRRGAGGRCRDAGPPGCAVPVASAGRCRARPGAPRPFANGRSPGVATGAGPARQPADAREAVVDLDHALEEASEDALLALEHLALRIEEQLERRVEARMLLRASPQLDRVRRSGRPRASSAGSSSLARRASCRSISMSTCSMSMSISPFSSSMRRMSASSSTRSRSGRMRRCPAAEPRAGRKPGGGGPAHPGPRIGGGGPAIRPGPIGPAGPARPGGAPPDQSAARVAGDPAGRPRVQRGAPGRARGLGRREVPGRRGERTGQSSGS